MASHKPIVWDLIRLLHGDDALAQDLVAAIHTAALPSIRSLEDFYDYLDRLVVLVPTDRKALAGFSIEFYYIVDQSPRGVLETSDAFGIWSKKFVDAWARFLDAPDSTAGIDSFFGDRRYRLDDYQRGPSGWMSFNQFFARQVKPGRRPVAGLCDDTIVVSPADSTFMAQLPVDADSTITLPDKHTTFRIQELLDHSVYGDEFAGGVFTHSLLNTWDYHRFHVPVAGRVLEAKKIPGIIGLDIRKNENGELVPQAGTGFQFTQDRGLLVLDSPVGVVALLPVGMAQISSIVITAEVGANLAKGEEFGYFQFGGSDIVTVYQADRVTLTAEIGEPYDQGAAIGTAGI